MKLSFGFKIGVVITLLSVGLTVMNVFFFYTNTRDLIINQMTMRLTAMGQVGSFLFDQPERELIKQLHQQIEQHALPLTDEMRQLPEGEASDGLEPELAERLMQSAEFQVIVQKLRQIKASSRRQVTPLTHFSREFDPIDPPQVRYIYLLLQTRQTTGTYLVTFLADADYDEPDNGTPIGMLYHASPTINDAFKGEVQMAKEFITDQWGTFLSAAIPLKDADGHVIAVLGLDYDVSGLANQLNQLWQICLTIVGVSICLSLLLAIILSYWLSRPLIKLQEMVQRVGERDFNAFITVNSVDELGLLAQAFNAMVLEIRNYSASIEAQNYEMTQLTETLKENENRLTQFLEAMPVGVYITDANGEVVYINQHTLSLLNESGADSPEVILNRSLAGYTLYLAGTQQPYHVVDLPIVRALRGEVAHADDIEMQVGSKIVPLEVWAKPIFNTQQQIKYAIAIFRDITQRKRTERSLAEYHRTLEERVAQDTAMLRARVTELATLNRITQTVTAVYDLTVILRIVTQELVTLLAARSGGIALLNHDRTQLTIVADYTQTAGEVSTVGLVIPVAGNPSSTFVIVQAKSLVILQPQTNPMIATAHEILRLRQIECMMIVPLLARGGVIGTIGLDSDDPQREFTSDEVKLVETIAGQLAGAIERARLFEQEQRQRQIAESLRQVFTVLNSSLDQETVLNKIMGQLKKVIDYNGAAIFLQDGNELLLVEASEYAKIYIGTRILLDAVDATVLTFKAQKAQVISDVRIDPIWQSGNDGGAWDAFDNDPIRSWMGAPLLIDDNVIGVLTTDSFTVNAYSHSEAEILQLFANQAAIAIRNGQLYTQAQTARAAAEAASEAKGTFLANVSHELRTPLTSVLGFAKIVQKRLHEIILPQLPDNHDPKLERAKRQVTENMAIIITEGSRLTTLINDVLDLAKIEADKVEWHLQPLVIEELIEQALAATSALFAETHLQCITDIEPDLPLIMGDKDRLIQVIINLVSNAVKFTEVGTVTCAAYFQSNSCQVVVKVTDTGLGIAPADQNQVFEKFKQVGDTLTNKPKGTGLGLSICKEIVAHHGGHIWLESEFGRGSSFFFSLPVS